MIIYKITNKINGKIYIGQTVQKLSRRWKDHRTKNKSAISKAINKYGVDNFEISVICKCDSIEQMNYREEKYIKLFKTRFPEGYNIGFGGGNKRTSNETKTKLSKINKNTTPPSRKGCKLSKTHKEQISKKLKGRKRSDITIKKFKNTIKNTGTSNKRVKCLNNNKTYQSMSEAASELKLTPLGVSRAARGVVKSYKGYKFVMENNNV